MRPEGLFGVSWQTKTERKRRGTKFVVPDVSFSKCVWFKVGLDLFNSEFPLVERDFWIPEMENKTSWRSSSPEYARSLQWLHHLVCTMHGSRARMPESRRRPWTRSLT